MPGDKTGCFAQSQRDTRTELRTSYALPIIVDGPCQDRGLPLEVPCVHSPTKYVSLSGLIPVLSHKVFR